MTTAIATATLHGMSLFTDLPPISPPAKPKLRPKNAAPDRLTIIRLRVLTRIMHEG